MKKQTHTIVDEYREAYRDYKLALQDENLATQEYINIAIMKTNAAKDRLNLLIKEIRKQGVTV